MCYRQNLTITFDLNLTL